VGNDWLIEKGLAAGERVVVEGTQKAREGTVVDAEPYQAPGTNAAAGVSRK
jgi:membrane fusion protein (multidrug efflux system)